MVITRIDAKLKLSQNRSAEDVDGVITGLRQQGDEASAAAVSAATGRQPLPAANHRSEG